MKSNEKKYTMSLASVMWLVLMTTILVIVAFCHFPRGADWHWLLPLDGFYHIPMMLAGVAVVVLLALLCFKFCKSNELNRRRLLITSIIITILQTVLVYSYYVHTDWDVQQIIGTAKAMAQGDSVEDFRWYFQWAPNNLLLTRLFAAVFFVTGPLWGFKATLFPLLALQSAGACLTALMLTQTAMHIWHRKDCAILTYLFYTLLVWMSPWWSIPYSDIWGLMLAVTLLWLSTTLPFKCRWLKIFIVFATTAFSYYIRPQTVFVTLSVVLVKLLETLRNRKGLKSLLKPSGLALAGVMAGFLVVNAAMIGSPLHLQSSKALGVSHYLMLGANYQSIGIYSAQDVDFSRSFPKKKERRQAEMKEMRKRYHDLELSGTLLLWGRKNLLNFSDGTFYWGREGDFFKEVPDRSGPVAKTTRSLFHKREGSGKNYVAWSVATTTLWFGLLVISLFAALPRKRHQEAFDDNGRRIIDIVIFALLMLIAFHTLCEARARYLFCFTPLFVLAAVEGARRLLGGLLQDKRR